MTKWRQNRLQLKLYIFIFYVFTTWQCRQRCIMFLCCPLAAFVRSSEHILLPRYFTNSWRNLEEAYREYSLAATDDLIRFWRSKVKVAAGHRGQILWKPHLMNYSSIKFRPYWVITWLDFRYQRSKVKVRAGRRGGKGIDGGAGTLNFIL